MPYTTGQLCAIFRVSRQTISNWSEEFAQHLSISASPQPGRHRQFTDEDVQVLALVRDMKKTGMLYADIHMSLVNGQRGDFPLTGKDITTDQRQEVAVLQAALEYAEQEKRKLADQVGELQSKYDQEKGKVAILEQRLNDATQQVIDLSIRLREAERKD